VRTYDAMASTMTAVAYVCGRWGDVDTTRILQRGIMRIYAEHRFVQYQIWADLQYYIPSKIVFAALLGASVGRNLEGVAPLFEQEIKKGNERVPVARVYPPQGYVNEHETRNLLQGFENTRAPISYWLHKTLCDELSTEFVSQEDFDENFRWVEVVLSLAFHNSFKADETWRYYPTGIFPFRRNEWIRLKDHIFATLEQEGDKSQYVRARFLGSNAASVKELLDGLVESVRTTPIYR
jgi:hypothetical protein